MQSKTLLLLVTTVFLFLKAKIAEGKVYFNVDLQKLTENGYDNEKGIGTKFEKIGPYNAHIIRTYDYYISSIIDEGNDLDIINNRISNHKFYVNAVAYCKLADASNAFTDEEDGVKHTVTEILAFNLNYDGVVLTDYLSSLVVFVKSGSSPIWKEVDVSSTTIFGLIGLVNYVGKSIDRVEKNILDISEDDQTLDLEKVRRGYYSLGENLKVATVNVNNNDYYVVKCKNDIHKVLDKKFLKDDFTDVNNVVETNKVVSLVYCPTIKKIRGQFFPTFKSIGGVSHKVSSGLCLKVENMHKELGASFDYVCFFRDMSEKKWLMAPDKYDEDIKASISVIVNYEIDEQINKKEEERIEQEERKRRIEETMRQYREEVKKEEEEKHRDEEEKKRRLEEEKKKMEETMRQYREEVREEEEKKKRLEEEKKKMEETMKQYREEVREEEEEEEEKEKRRLEEEKKKMQEIMKKYREEVREEEEEERRREEEVSRKQEEEEEYDVESEQRHTEPHKDDEEETSSRPIETKTDEKSEDIWTPVMILSFSGVSIGAFVVATIFSVFCYKKWTS